MSLFGRLFKGEDEESYQRGIVLYENGKYTEAIECFRKIANEQEFSPFRSLAMFHLRQALINESRRLFRIGKAAIAISYLQEATANWEKFPDLQFLLGAARGLTGDWETALGAAHKALRLNADYCEARLLEACALQQLARIQESANSLNSLIESGRRCTHWLINELTRVGGYQSDTLPDSLVDKVLQVAGGSNQKDEAAAAAGLCRSGKWEQGLQKFASLVERYPSYPDFRVQYAASLYQLGRVEDALVQVTAALDLNVRYRAALYLRGVVLADLGHLPEARDQLSEAFCQGQLVETSSHEDLLICYLRAVLELLMGHPKNALNMLEPWPDLTHSFARAELVRAVAEYFLGQISSSGQRLMKLAEFWPEQEYQFLYKCHFLWERQYDYLASALAEWSASQAGDDNARRILLLAELALAQNQPLPDSIVEIVKKTAHYRPAGLYQQAQALAESLDWAGCWMLCKELVDQGYVTEQIVTLYKLAQEKPVNEQAVSTDQEPLSAEPDAEIIQQVYTANRQGRATHAAELISLREMAHPTNLVWSWLSAKFWIDPIRRWIG